MTLASQADLLLDIPRIYDVALSPDGRRVACVVRTVDRAADRYRDTIWLAEEGVDGTWTARALTGGAHADGSPRWSPDGRSLAVVSDREGTSQLYLLDPDTAGARRLTNLPAGVSDPSWSPDGTRMAFLSLAAQQQDEEPDPLIRHVRRLPFRSNGRGYIGDRFDHLWTVDVETGATAQLTHGPQDDRAAAWSPDGARVAFTSLRSDRLLPPWETQLYVLDVPARGAAAGRTDPGGSTSPDGARQVSRGVEGTGEPAWSPDGERLVFTASEAGSRLSSDAGVYVTAADGHEPARRLDRAAMHAVDCQPDFDTLSCTPASPRWLPDGTVLVGACEAGHLGVHRLDPGTGDLRPVIGGERAVGRVSLSADGRRVAYLATDWTTPGSVYVAAADGSGETRLPLPGTEPDAYSGTSRPELLRVPTHDGRFVLDAWLFRPAGRDPEARHPIVSMAHGGPDGTYGPAFHFLVQLLAARGFNVLLVNARGGLSYGRSFDGLEGHYGELDERDHWTCLEAAVASGGVDPERAGFYGHSYGGFMATWMTGRTDRYRAVVASSIMGYFVTQSLTADYGGTYDWADRGEWPNLWDDPLEWWCRSPIAYVPRMRTPILFLMGEEDWRTPPVEHELLFTALAMRGVPTEMIRFVGAGHGVSTTGAPSVRVERMRRIAEWFERWLGPPAAEGVT